MDFLTPSTLAILMVGATHYVDIGADKDAVIYYETESAAHMVLPDGASFSGDWELTDEGYFVSWRDGPSGSWKLSHTPGRISYVNGEGRDFGPITRIVFGNAESLPAS